MEVEDNTVDVKHTPGPWKAEHSGTGDATVIACPGWTHKDGSNFSPTIVGRIGWEDARLIAAAPDLLAALKHIEALRVANFDPRDIAWEPAVREMHAAIAKAEGR